MNLFDVLFAKKLSGGGSPFPPVIKRVTGNPIEFSDGADAPLVKCVTAITGYQEGTGTPSPENVRPIVAYTENTISVGGNEYSGADNLTVFNSGTSIVVQSNNKRLVSKGVPVNNNDSVFIKFDNTQFKLASMFYYDNPTITVGAIANNQTINLENTSGEYKFKATNGGYVYFYFVPNEDRNVSPSELSDTVICVMNTTHTTYPSAIYRGSEDVVNGKVESEWLAFDMGDVTWTYNAGLDSMTLNLSLVKLPPTNAVAVELICSTCQTIPADQRTTVAGMRAYILADSTTLYIRGSGYTSASDFKTAMTGQTIAYRLATPTTSSVTPSNLPIKSLSGYNHIESSTGDMTIDYITEGYQNFVDTVESALPNTRKGGVKAFDIFKTLDEPKTPEASTEEGEPEEKETEEVTK